jgi:FtsP/CotA-like multicopper oxidase with cupredoxin domain
MFVGQLICNSFRDYFSYFYVLFCFVPRGNIIPNSPVVGQFPVQGGGHVLTPPNLDRHGFLQKETPYYDGVPSVGVSRLWTPRVFAAHVLTTKPPQQCPIAPGSTFTYKFRASQFGTTWYHAHYSAQYSGGVVGPLIVFGPKNVPCDIDLGPVMLSDWYHKPYETIVENVVGTDVSLLPPTSACISSSPASEKKSARAMLILAAMANSSHPFRLIATAT